MHATINDDDLFLLLAVGATKTALVEELRRGEPAEEATSRREPGHMLQLIRRHSHESLVPFGNLEAEAAQKKLFGLACGETAKRHSYMGVSGSEGAQYRPYRGILHSELLQSSGHNFC